MKNAKDKDARATVFAMERIKGKTLTEIAEAYNCHPDTVVVYTKRARDRGLVIGFARELIQDKLLPLTLAVYERHLMEGNLEAAQDILFGMGILQRNSVIKHESDDAEETLEAFRKQFFEARQTTAIAVDIIPPTPAAEVSPETPPAPAIGPVGPVLNPREQIYLSPRRLADLQHQSDEDA